jgi:hypothetical protein
MRLGNKSQDTDGRWEFDDGNDAQRSSMYVLEKELQKLWDPGRNSILVWTPLKNISKFWWSSISRLMTRHIVCKSTSLN